MRNLRQIGFGLIAIGIASVGISNGWKGNGSMRQFLTAAETAPSRAMEQAEFRAPVDLAVAPDATWLVAANEVSGTLSLIDLTSGLVVDELKVGAHPGAVKVCLDGRHVLVSCSYGGEVVLVEVRRHRLIRKAAVAVGFEPLGLAVSPQGSTAYVGLNATGEVAELDLTAGRIVRRYFVGAWPRYLALSPDGTRLAVGCSGESKIAVVDTARGEVAFDVRLTGGMNIGHLQVSRDGLYAYFPWIVYRGNPITIGNIRLGWVLASRLGRVRLDEKTTREALSLDVSGKAVADPHGLVISPNEHRLIVSASGTHELLVYRREDLPLTSGSPGDLIDRRLLRDNDLFYRIEVGGRPMGMAAMEDNRTVYVANYTLDCIQQVDLELRDVVRTIPLGTEGLESVVHRGMEIFYDGRRSLDQWYSCHSCHYNGGVNVKPMDTMNDGSNLTLKTVLPLFYLDRTGPWTWHGWQTDLHDAMRKSFTVTMQGPPIDDEDTRAVLEFLFSLEPPPNPFRNPDGSLTEAALRGKAVFESSKAGCANCHNGPFYTDGKIHDVGLGSASDRYSGFNTPMLVGAYRKVRFLHDGRAKSLEEVITGDHSPEKVEGEAPLTADEVADLVAFLKSL